MARYLASLRSEPSSTPLPSAPERSVIDKIADVTRRVRKTISDGKLNKAAQVEWTTRLFSLLRPVYGKQSPLVVMLDQWRKETIETPLSTEAFVLRVTQVVHFLASPTHQQRRVRLSFHPDLH